jgi:hypothetical protein
MIATEVSPAEIAAADFIKERYGESQTLLISDPATAYLLEGLSGINTQGGAYANAQTREILLQVGQTMDVQTVKKLLYQVQDTLDTTAPNHVLFAVSGRYFQWQQANETQKKDLSFNIWVPHDLSFSDIKYIQQLTYTPEFRLIYKNDGVAILELARPHFSDTGVTYD